MIVGQDIIVQISTERLTRNEPSINIQSRVDGMLIYWCKRLVINQGIECEVKQDAAVGIYPSRVYVFIKEARLEVIGDEIQCYQVSRNRL